MNRDFHKSGDLVVASRGSWCPLGEANLPMMAWSEEFLNYVTLFVVIAAITKDDLNWCYVFPLDDNKEVKPGWMLQHWLIEHREYT